MEDVIQLKKSNILRFGIKDENGNITGEILTFDLEDIELPLKINRCEAEHRKNVEYLQGKFVIIDKKEDHKGKYLLSWKEEEKLKVFKEFYKREMDALDLFLGEGGTKKLLNGRNPYYTMYDDINEILEPIMPKLLDNAKSIENKIKEKYKNIDSKEILK